MTALENFPKWLLFSLFALVAICGCKKSEVASSTDEEEYEEGIFHVDMQYFNFDKVNNLSLFFDSLRNKHGIPIWSYENSEIIEKDVFKCIERIEGFRKGRYKFYPDSLVRSCIDFLGYNNTALASHADSLDIGFSEWFLMLAAYYSPDITCLVHMQTPNHRAGIQNFGFQYNYTLWWSYLFLKREKGFEVRRIGEDEKKVEKIFQLEDHKHRLYYLCSNNISNIEFSQVLFWVKGEYDVVMVAQCDYLPNNSETDYDKIYFNPEQKVWYYCKEDTNSGKFIPVTGAPTLRLCLDGEKSFFIHNERN